MKLAALAGLALLALASAALTMQRQHSLADAVGAAMGYDAADVDEIWRAAALL